MAYSSCFPKIQERLLKNGYIFTEIWEVFQFHLGWAIDHFATEDGPDEVLYRAELEVWKYFWDEKISAFPGEKPQPGPLLQNSAVRSQSPPGIMARGGAGAPCPQPQNKFRGAKQPGPSAGGATSPQTPPVVVTVRASWTQRAMDQIKLEMENVSHREKSAYSTARGPQDKHGHMSMEAEVLPRAFKGLGIHASPNSDAFQSGKTPTKTKEADVNQAFTMQPAIPQLKSAQDHYGLNETREYYTRQPTYDLPTSQPTAYRYASYSEMCESSEMRRPDQTPAQSYPPHATTKVISSSQSEPQPNNSLSKVDEPAQNTGYFYFGSPSKKGDQKLRGERESLNKSSQKKRRSASPDPKHRYPLRSRHNTYDKPICDTCGDKGCWKCRGREASRERSR